MGMSEENGKLCFNCSKNSKNPITSVVMDACLLADGCIWFDDKLKITKLELKQENSQDDKLKILITKLFYFFQMVHATEHVYCFVLLSAAINGTKGTKLFDFINKAHRFKVYLKYLQVNDLLITDDERGILVGGFWKVDHNKALRATTKIFEHIASASNAEEWFENIYCAGIKRIIQHPRLKSIIEPYVEMAQNLGKDITSLVGRSEARTADAVIKRQLNISCKSFGITSVRNWIECQSMAGAMH
eukprot:UN27585